MLPIFNLLKSIFFGDEKARIRKKAIAALRQAGWSEGRDIPGLEREYIQVLGGAWISEATPFVRQFGRLSIRNKLWTEPELVVYYLDHKMRVEAVVKGACCPVATSAYLGDGCAIWLDNNLRFYASDSEGMMFLGEGADAMFDVVLGGAKPADAPLELRSGLAKAWEWGAVKAADEER